MSPRESRIALFIAVTGLATCLAAMVYFLFTISDNRLNLSAEQPVRDHYVAVGHFYAQGFIVGFFLCLCLAVVAAATASWFDHRKAVALDSLEEGPPAEGRLVASSRRFRRAPTGTDP